MRPSLALAPPLVCCDLSTTACHRDVCLRPSACLQILLPLRSEWLENGSELPWIRQLVPPELPPVLLMAAGEDSEIISTEI